MVNIAQTMMPGQQQFSPQQLAGGLMGGDMSNNNMALTALGGMAAPQIYGAIKHNSYLTDGALGGLGAMAAKKWF